MSMRENIAARFRAFMTDYDDDCGIPEAEAEAVLNLLSPAQCHAEELVEALRVVLPIAARNEAGEAVSRAQSLLAKLEKEEGK